MDTHGGTESVLRADCRIRRFTALIGLGVLVLGSVCSAQDSKPQDLSDMSLEQLGQLSVYSASKREQGVKDAPSSVTVITADEIQRYGYRTLAEILETVRGFYVTNDRYQSYVGVRGFGRLGDWNSRILLLVDGHRINDNVLGQAFIGLEFPVDIDLIQRIEIIRGPSSSLYGAEAFFGVINVITRKENQPSLAVPKIPRTQSVKMAPDSASNSRTASIPTAAQQSD